MNVYLVRFDGLHDPGNAAIVAENQEHAYELLMAELKERMLPQSGPRIEEVVAQARAAYGRFCLTKRAVGDTL